MITLVKLEKNCWGVDGQTGTTRVWERAVTFGGETFHPDSLVAEEKWAHGQSDGFVRGQKITVIYRTPKGITGVPGYNLFCLNSDNPLTLSGWGVEFPESEIARLMDEAREKRMVPWDHPEVKALERFASLPKREREKAYCPR